jgi:hypothetical protein
MRYQLTDESYDESPLFFLSLLFSFFAFFFLCSGRIDFPGNDGGGRLEVLRCVVCISISIVGV